MERELIARARQGDHDAYAALVGQHQEAVFRLAYLFVGDADDAQDIAQEAFIRAYQHLGGFDTTRPLRPWLLGIAANLARNRRRAWSRYLTALQRFARTLPAEPHPEALHAEQAAAHELWQAVRRLRPVDQEVIYLRYFMELSVSETAEILSIEPGTVKSRLSRALGRLRAIVREDFPLLMEGQRL